MITHMRQEYNLSGSRYVLLKIEKDRFGRNVFIIEQTSRKNVELYHHEMEALIKIVSEYFPDLVKTSLGETSSSTHS